MDVPGAHISGGAANPGQREPGGQVWHAASPEALPNVPDGQGRSRALRWPGQ